MNLEQSLGPEPGAQMTRSELAILYAKDQDPVIMGELRERIMEDIDRGIAEFPRSAPLAQQDAAQGQLLADISRLPQDAADLAIAKLNTAGIIKTARARAKLADLAKLSAEPKAVIVANGELCSPALSEDALAMEFTRRHGDDWAFVAEWGQWLKWDGTRWAPEKTTEAFDLARKVCRSAAARGNADGRAINIASGATAAAVERLARADRKHAATADIWDRDPWLLNTPLGIVDLHDGSIRQHSQDFHMTKVTAASPQGDAPLWQRFLDDVTNGAAELKSYLARVAGYCLTGMTNEHALFFFFGTGSNGKSILINALKEILGDYSTSAPAEAFVESRNDSHPTDMAGLRGARLVVASEIAAGRRWKETRIKQLTGGEPITARFMRQDFFEYAPQFKLLISGNNRPAVSDVGKAMRRRLNLIPFTVEIGPDREDKELGAKLLRERDGILRWALEGCLEWQRIGLNPPECVVSATEDYLASEDTMSRWIEDECERCATARATTKELYESWSNWAVKQGEQPGSTKKLVNDLSKLGFGTWRDNRHRGIKGLKLRGMETQDEMPLGSAERDAE